MPLFGHMPNMSHMRFHADFVSAEGKVDQLGRLEAEGQGRLDECPRSADIQQTRRSRAVPSTPLNAPTTSKRHRARLSSVTHVSAAVSCTPILSRVFTCGTHDRLVSRPAR